MEKKPLVFKPTDEEEIIIEVNNIKWSEFCHKNLTRVKNGNKTENLHIVKDNILLIFFGFLLAMLAFLINNPIVFGIMVLFASISVFLGLFFIIQEVNLPGRR